MAELRELAHGHLPGDPDDAGLGAALRRRPWPQPMSSPSTRDGTQAERDTRGRDSGLRRAARRGGSAGAASSGPPSYVPVRWLREGWPSCRRKSATTDDPRPAAICPSMTGSARSAAASPEPRTDSGRRSRASSRRRRRMLTREGIGAARSAGAEVVAQVRGATDCSCARSGHRPDVAVVDIRMPPTHTDEGLVAAQRIREELPGRRRPRALSVHRAPVRHAPDRATPRAVGYLLKERVFDGEILVDALRRMADGETVMDPTIVSMLFGRRRRTDPLAVLSGRRRSTGADRGGALDETAARAGRHGADGRGPRDPDLRQAPTPGDTGRPSPGTGRAHLPQELNTGPSGVTDQPVPLREPRRPRPRGRRPERRRPAERAVRSARPTVGR